MHDTPNSRPLAGATVSWYLRASRWVLFQSTPPCGGDETPLAGPGITTIFQSTPPCGGDLAYGLSLCSSTYFNPRPLAGATPAISGPMRKVHFNPRPLAGATICSNNAWSDSDNFNPRPLAGATDLCGTGPGRGRFQSTPPCGGDI